MKNHCYLKSKNIKSFEFYKNKLYNYVMFTIAASGDFMSDKEIDMQEAKEACFEFVSNYYSEQGKFPREFTFCGVVFPFCDYLGWFSDEEIEDMKVNI